MGERLQGKTAIITGGAGGIGAATVERFVEEGANVMISDLDAARGRALAERLGSSAAFVEHDVSSEPQWLAVVKETVARFGAIHIVFNNAGIEPSGTIEDTTLEQWRAQFAVHADGAFLGSKYCFPEMRKAGYGSIIHTSSSSVAVGYSFVLGYAAAKSAQHAMARSIAAHCRERGYPIRCNVILPGGIATPMVRRAFTSIGDLAPNTVEHYLDRIGQPIDIANVALFLASEESRYINGQAILVDGGMTLSVNSRTEDRLGPGYNIVNEAANT